MNPLAQDQDGKEAAFEAATADVFTSIPTIPLRPSLLPKLAECPRYESSPFAGAAADRGTAMDTSFRAILTGEHVAWAPDTNREDAEAVEWAVNMARTLAGGASVLAKESELGVSMLGMTGTADAACSEKLWSADLKSGQLRSYEEQQAAYALGFMEREFCEEWTTHLLFCDERKLVTQHWTHESAWDVVNPVLAVVKDPNSAPTPCEYCSWCAKKWTCKERLEPLSMLLTGAPDKLDLERIKADPGELGALLSITHEIAKDDGLHNYLKEAGLAFVLKGQAVPGWQMQAGRKTETVPALMLAENFGPKNLLRDAGSAKVMQAIGNITGSKFKTLWSEFYSEDAPESAIQTNHGSAFLAKSRKKQKA